MKNRSVARSAGISPSVAPPFHPVQRVSSARQARQQPGSGHGALIDPRRGSATPEHVPSPNRVGRSVTPDRGSPPTSVSRTSFVAWSVRGYALGIGALLVTRLGIGDQTPTLFAIHAFFHLAFLPLPLVLLVAVVARRREPALVFGVGAALWTFFWGPLFWPHHTPHSQGPKLTVLTYNVLGYNHHADETLRVIREANADVVALQELNLETSGAIERGLAKMYPHRWLVPRRGVSGAGLLSRYPFERETDLPTTQWQSPPLVARLDVAGHPLVFVAFHAASGPQHLKRREQQARALAARAQQRGDPIVLAGDLNATDQHRAYAVITKELEDCWRVAGWGFGHTFPGPPTREVGGSRPTILGVPVPEWLVRLDYVFYSPELVALDARLAPLSRASDHRGVIATLAWR